MKSIDAQFFTGPVSPWTNPKGCLVRDGRVGHSGDLLSGEHRSRIDVHMRSRLAELACDFPYDDHFGGPP
jgi:hypothetical protein